MIFIPTALRVFSLYFNLLCCWEDTFTVPLSAQVYNWVLANLILNLHTSCDSISRNVVAWVGMRLFDHFHMTFWYFDIIYVFSR